MVCKYAAVSWGKYAAVSWGKYAAVSWGISWAYRGVENAPSLRVCA